MFNSDDITSQLLAPQEDEPADLRRDITDELLDHLQCAVHREQLAGSTNAQDTQTQVLKRFGNPAAIAATLWWDHMKGRIMRQWIVSASAVVLVCGPLWGIWQIVHIQQEFLANMQSAQNEFIRRQSEQTIQLVANSQENARIIAEQFTKSLQELNNQSRSNAAESEKSVADAKPDPAQWTTCEFKFVKGAKDGLPAEGVHLKANYLIPGEVTGKDVSLSHEGTSGPNGILKWDIVHIGTYGCQISYQGHEIEYFTTVARPFQPIQQTIVCPAEPAKNEVVQLKFAWPEDIAALEPLVFSQFDDVGLWLLLEDHRWQSQYLPASLVQQDGDDFFGWREKGYRTYLIKGNWLLNSRGSSIGSGQPLINSQIGALLSSGSVSRQQISPAAWESIKQLERHFRDASLSPGQPRPDTLEMDTKHLTAWPTRDYRLSYLDVAFPMGKIAPNFVSLAHTKVPFLESHYRENVPLPLALAAVRSPPGYQNALSEQSGGLVGCSYHFSEETPPTLTITPSDAEIAAIRKRIAYLTELDGILTPNAETETTDAAASPTTTPSP